MHSIFFWRTWLKEYRLLWLAMAALLAFAFLYLWFCYFKGADSVIHWEKLQEQKVIETQVHSFRMGPFELAVPAESYVIFEYFNGSNVIPNTTASYIFLFLLIVCSMVILTIVTTLEKFWYLIGMALFIVFIISLRLEVLAIFEMTNRAPVVAILILYILPSFYFNRFRVNTPFITRLAIFLGIALLIGLIIHFFSAIGYPFYHLTLTAYAPALILTVLFIMMVAHEVMASFVSLISQVPSKNLQHLSIIGVIYLANLFITSLHEVGTVQWNFIYINLYLLLSVSAILGIWGFKQREVLYGNVTQYYPFGGFFFLALGAICFATIAQLLGNANDPALKIIRDAIIFSHTGYSLIFFAYVLSNFITLLGENRPVYKVLYHPNRMPYFTYRFAGLIVMLAFVFYSNWREYVYHGLAGFYNSAGDLYTLFKNDRYAESFYDRARVQGFQNHRSNYILGTKKAARFSFEPAHYNFQLANAKRPTEYSLTNAGNVFLWENNLFSAIRSYKRSLKFKPASGALTNNLGVAYAKVHNLDSALFFLNSARNHGLTRATAETNFFAMAAAESVPVKADSILKSFNASATATISNALVVASLHQQPFTTQTDPLSQKRLDVFSASLLNNYIIKNVKSLDTAFIHRAHVIVSDTLNAGYNEALKASLAFAFYHQGNISKALEILAELAYISQTHQGKFNYIMGLWALEQNNPELAASYFSYANTYDYKNAKFYHAIALTEARKIQKALVAWDSVSQSKDEAQREISEEMKRILKLSASEVLTLSDAIKYQFCRYRINLSDSLLFNKILNTVDNPNYKAQALLDISRRYFEADHIPAAIVYFRRISGLQMTDRDLYERCRHFELLMLAHRGEVQSLANQINKGITFEVSRSVEKTLYTALINEASGEMEAAEKNFEILATYNPYFEEGIIAAANFFRKRDNTGMKPYTILAEAIQVNGNSIRLLRAYIREALRMGFDDYATNAAATLSGIEN